MEQTVLDLTAARAARDEAIEQVGDKVGEEWMVLAMDAVYILAAKGEFTSDDIWRVVPKPREPRALGAVLAYLAKVKYIKRTGRYVQTAQRSRHAAPIAVWKRRAI